MREGVGEAVGDLGLAGGEEPVRDGVGEDDLGAVVAGPQAILVSTFCSVQTRAGKKESSWSVSTMSLKNFSVSAAVAGDGVVEQAGVEAEGGEGGAAELRVVVLAFVVQVLVERRSLLEAVKVRVRVAAGVRHGDLHGGGGAPAGHHLVPGAGGGAPAGHHRHGSAGRGTRPRAPARCGGGIATGHSFEYRAAASWPLSESHSNLNGCLLC